MRYTNKMYLRGVAADAVGSNADRIWFFAEALDRVEWHVTQGHKIVIVSGSLEMLARQAARELEAHLTARGIAVSVHVIATRLEETEGRWTGRIAGEAMLGKAKARAAERLATEMGFELGSSYAYGDSVNDRWLLASVGRPTVVNPSRKLLQIVRGRKWPAAIWQKHER